MTKCNGYFIPGTLAAIANQGDDMAVLDVGYEIAYQLLYYLGNMETPIVSIINGIASKESSYIFFKFITLANSGSWCHDTKFDTI